jgi:uncharacterized membrane protein YjgN (DUF898 family)
VDQPALTAPFVHHGRTGAIIRVALVNLLLNIVTFSIWRFWGKTRVRRALWAGTSAWGDPAEYTGTGGELFLGFIVIMVAVYSPIMVAMTAAQVAMAAGNPIGTLVVMLLMLLVFVLAAAGLYRARRYQLSRTVWRGIRGGQGGNAIHYGLLYLGVTLVVMLSLGWALPWAEMQLACYRMGNTTFGDARFTCNARAKPLYKRYAVLWVAGLVFFAGIGLGIAGIVEAYDPENEEDLALMILGLYGAAIPWSLLTLGVPMAWYRAAFFRELAAHTRFDGIGFALEATTGGLIRLALGNWFISVLSLGILRPWAAVRTFRYACNHLRMEAEPNWERVHQNQAELARTGEGLAAVFEGAGEF